MRSVNSEAPISVETLLDLMESGQGAAAETHVRNDRNFVLLRLQKSGFTLFQHALWTSNTDMVFQVMRYLTAYEIKSQIAEMDNPRFTKNAAKFTDIDNSIKALENYQNNFSLWNKTQQVKATRNIINLNEKFPFYLKNIIEKRRFKNGADSSNMELFTVQISGIKESWQFCQDYTKNCKAIVKQILDAPLTEDTDRKFLFLMKLGLSEKLSVQQKFYLLALLSGKNKINNMQELGDVFHLLVQIPDAKEFFKIYRETLPLDSAEDCDFIFAQFKRIGMTPSILNEDSKESVVSQQYERLLNTIILFPIVNKNIQEIILQPLQQVPRYVFAMADEVPLFAREDFFRVLLNYTSPVDFKAFFKENFHQLLKYENDFAKGNFEKFRDNLLSSPAEVVEYNTFAETQRAFTDVSYYLEYLLSMNNKNLPSETTYNMTGQVENFLYTLLDANKDVQTTHHAYLMLAFISLLFHKEKENLNFLNVEHVITMSWQLANIYLDTDPLNKNELIADIWIDFRTRMLRQEFNALHKFTPDNFARLKFVEDELKRLDAESRMMESVSIEEDLLSDILDKDSFADKLLMFNDYLSTRDEEDIILVDGIKNKLESLKFILETEEPAEKVRLSKKYVNQLESDLSVLMLEGDKFKIQIKKIETRMKYLNSLIKSLEKNVKLNDEDKLKTKVVEFDEELIFEANQIIKAEIYRIKKNGYAKIDTMQEAIREEAKFINGIDFYNINNATLDKIVSLYRNEFINLNWDDPKVLSKLHRHINKINEVYFSDIFINTLPPISSVKPVAKISASPSSSVTSSKGEIDNRLTRSRLFPRPPLFIKVEKDREVKLPPINSTLAKNKKTS